MRLHKKHHEDSQGQVPPESKPETSGSPPAGTGPSPEQGAALAAEVQDLKVRAETLEREKTELFEKLQRLSADYANFQKRVPRQVSDSVSYEKEKIIRSLLPALDNFDRTVRHAQSASDVAALTEGVRIIYSQMLDVLKGHAVDQIKALGQAFDPAFHEALMHRYEADKADQVVLEEYQVGYTLNGRVLRPSKVVINRIPPSPAEEPAPAEPTTQAEGQADQTGTPE